jgi:8-oxo-dGTP diphosphatase
MDAGDRNAWTGDHDVRPLTNLGRRQADVLASALAHRGISALYVSPAMRARQTLEPLAATTGLTIETLPAIAEKQPGEDRPAMVERAWNAFQEIAGAQPDATVAAVSHGDLIPALIQHLATELRLGSIPNLANRSQHYEIEINDDVTISFKDTPAGFPL